MAWYVHTGQAMSSSAIHFQKGLTLPEFQRLYGIK
jgi:hypothetical protein